MMNLYRRFILVGLFVSMIAESRGQEQDIVHLHGSGTTNPSKCYWDILSLMTNGIRHPSRLTYRSVGSSIGQEEIVNAFNTTSGAVDFASGDIPITTELYDGLTDQGIEILHLPVLLGAVTVFHSVPVNEPYQLNLTSCVLAKIFMGEITVWSDPIIAALNPEMLADNMPINVAVRDSGSSSTSSFTEYLNNACGDSFPSDMVSDFPTNWPSSFQQCAGSAGMATCIHDKEGSIGYIDAGHGLSAGLAEIELENADGVFLTSTESALKGGLIAAAEGQFPDSPLDNFGEVSLVNRPGQWTWPIVQATYLYVRRNIKYLGNPLEQSLLVAFLESFLESGIVGVCADEYGFTIPSSGTQDFVRTGIDLIKADLSSGALPWTWEIDATAFTGADSYTISTKTRDISVVQIEDLQSHADKMQATIDALRMDVHELNVILEKAGLATGLVDENFLGSTTVAGYASNFTGSFSTSNSDVNVQAALVLSSISFVLSVIISMLMMTSRYKSKKQDITQPSMEQPQTVHA